MTELKIPNWFVPGADIPKNEEKTEDGIVQMLRAMGTINPELAEKLLKRYQRRNVDKVSGQDNIKDIQLSGEDIS